MASGAPTPLNETQRLACVSALRLLEAEPDPMLDQLVRTLALQFQVPISLVSIIDERRQWFRARTGLAAAQTPRDQSFCAYAILGKEVFQVPDTHLDPRFVDNPLVTGEPGIRFYAAAPLITDDGMGLGGLCIIDTVPRPPLTPDQQAVLEHFAQLAMLRLTHLRGVSYLDAPTGLFNRLRLEQDIALALANRGHSLVVIDLVTPGFLNDIVRALGYNFSQELVNVLHHALRDHLPPGQALYKITPTRFGFLLASDQVGAERAFARLLSAFEAPLACGNIPIQTQPGIGAIALEHEGGDLERDWLRLAVSAADDARGRGTGWCWYEPHLDLAQQRAFLLLTSLAEAVRSENQFHLVYQPRLEVASGQVTTVEALLRWQHPVLGPVSPGEFVPLAEKTALMEPLSLWVLKHVVEQAARWQRQGLHFRVAINVSAPDLASARFTDKLVELVTLHGLDPHRLEIEFTESALSQNLSMVRDQLLRLRALGMDISIDDFGSGYSNWSYLSRLPATTLKLDRSLIQNITEQEKDYRLVEAMVELARRIGYRTVAEGVETPQQYALVSGLGCQQVQGFLIARPMAANALEAWMTHQRRDMAAQLRQSGP
ncbi:MULTISPECIES: bifunctional diguanylate cyclase/phosphodiesterase [unclassified Pseudomonas]|uniref:putative bifunctional diguanylate cyclase/phosphodiesterase n=1 Tax=unclassified Pseudomonas TaxID=196821 RepID=UPI000BC9E45D|nr:MULTISPECIES: GGDEF and EAL domain-containing protein [unclassified Pseudomonas]PVZ13776.1 EAL domain-containing protein (putative c-di-GMP-specific phosphodiesterase class I) [Pseudomonas sp. URIL14HWK12:I12]PVZ24082.1 EAL domain-containing protein (putative c-di-GMP-specific phosphodiesterase class I) [Pseudomonas sp. URIL14HWK12:I10]PVZ33279.1 EAL domain-containing protein (putative c-di-GMP-specific phosphodiesterase class I) [Pseudomonas sp. URIL14HWK12:I11]SNZ10983.1 diguanylate cyclas